MSVYARWLKPWAIGILLGALIFLIWRQSLFLRILGSLPGAVEGRGFSRIFLKNSAASLTTIYLGSLLCLVELAIYKNVPKKTYDFLESLTSPLYAVLRKIDAVYGALAPFYRSCYFYLWFVPSLSLFVNGFVLGSITAWNRSLLYPHGMLEIPGMLGSGLLGLYALERLRGPIGRSDIEELESGLRDNFRGRMLFSAGLLQGLLITAAYIEVNF